MPLKSILFEVDIHAARSSAIKMTQTYENLSELGMDVTFYYPVDANFAMSKIRVEFVDVDDPSKVSIIETNMEPKKQAEEKYEQIKKEGKEVALLATHAVENSRSLMKVQLGNFPPNSRAKVICNMFGELTYESLMEAFCFRLPLTYVPKYLLGNNGGMSDEKQEVKDTDYNQAQVGGGKHTSWNIILNVHKTAVSNQLSEVISHTHAIELDDMNDRTKVVIDFSSFDKTKVGARDYEIYLKEAAINQPNAQISQTMIGDREYASIMVNYLPLIATNQNSETHEKVQKKLLQQITAS